MRSLAWGLLLGMLVVVGPAAGEEGKGPLKPGELLPGPFHPYNVTGERKGFYHCLVSQAEFDPSVMLVVRGTALGDNAAFKTLLTGLDGLVKANTRARLKAFVVFLSEEVKKPLTDEDQRAPVAQKLEDLASGLKLQHVVLSLASADDLAKYAIPADAVLTALLFRRYRIEASEVLPADQINDARVKEILGAVQKKLLGKKGSREG